MNKEFTPLVSIIMPVFNTGHYLIEAINSVLNQKLAPDCIELPLFELLVIDDKSTDPATIKILDYISTLDPRIHKLKNQLTKGAAGARNTGIINSRGVWIAFLDSDDIWFPDSLSIRWKIISQNKKICWLAAKFQLLKPLGSVKSVLTFESAEHLMESVSRTLNPPEIVLFVKPVEKFTDSCMVGIMTVLILRDLIIEKRMFNEQLPRAEDYHLWFKCAFDNDLYMANCPVAFYRIHPRSLTHGNHPKHLHEDTMIMSLLSDPVGRIHEKNLMRRFDISMQEQCYFYREHKQFKAALKTALRWTLKRPIRMSACKEIAASLLRFN